MVMMQTFAIAILILLLLLVKLNYDDNHKQSTGLLSQADALDINDPHVHEAWESIEDDEPVCMLDNQAVSRSNYWDSQIEKHAIKQQTDKTNLERKLERMTTEVTKLQQQVLHAQRDLNTLNNIGPLQYMQQRHPKTTKQTCKECFWNKTCG